MTGKRPSRVACSPAALLLLAAGAAATARLLLSSIGTTIDSATGQLLHSIRSPSARDGHRRRLAAAVRLSIAIRTAGFSPKRKAPRLDLRRSRRSVAVLLSTRIDALDGRCQTRAPRIDRQFRSVQEDEFARRAAKPDPNGVDVVGGNPNRRHRGQEGCADLQCRFPRGPLGRRLPTAISVSSAYSSLSSTFSLRSRLRKNVASFVKTSAQISSGRGLNAVLARTRQRGT